jgi:hypothetical protein
MEVKKESYHEKVTSKLPKILLIQLFHNLTLHSSHLLLSALHIAILSKNKAAPF